MFGLLVRALGVVSGDPARACYPSPYLPESEPRKPYSSNTLFVRLPPDACRAADSTAMLWAPLMHPIRLNAAEGTLRNRVWFPSRPLFARERNDFSGSSVHNRTKIQNGLPQLSAFSNAETKLLWGFRSFSFMRNFPSVDHSVCPARRSTGAFRIVIGIVSVRNHHKTSL